MNHKTITGIVVAVLIAGAVYFIVNDQKNKKVEIRARQYATQEMCEASTGKHCVVGTCEGKKDTCPYGFSPWVPNPQSTTQQPTPTPTPTPKDETANWKTYNNTEFSYEVKYPNNWEVSQTGTQVSFMVIGGQDVFLTFFVFNKPINEAEALLPLLSVPGRKIDSRTNITINGIDWVKLVVEKNQIVQLTYHNNKTYAAQYSTFENVSPQILSTFKFTTTSTTSEYPAWIKNIIAEVESYPASNPRISLTQYQYRNQIVYYLPVTHCCDFTSSLYNESGEFICAPDGGFTGGGDGKCSDFFTARQNAKVIWTDTRGNDF